MSVETSIVWPFDICDRSSWAPVKSAEQARIR